MLDDGLYSRFPKPSTVIGFHDAARDPAGVIGVTQAMRWPMSTAWISGQGQWAGMAVSADDQGSDSPASRIVSTLQNARQPRERPGQLRRSSRSGVSRPAQSTTSSRTSQAAADGAQLHSRSAQASARRHPPNRPRRGDRAGMPKTRCGGHHPRGRVHTGDVQHPAAVGPRDCTVWRAVWRDARSEDSAVMGGEDSAAYGGRQQDPEPDLLGRRPPSRQYAAAGANASKCLAAQPLLGARRAAVIATATEARPRLQSTCWKKADRPPVGALFAAARSASTGLATGRMSLPR